MPSKREPISLVASVEEDRVRLGTFTPCPETNDSSQADALKIPYVSMSKVIST